MVVAAYLPKEVLNKAQKLVLMKIADSADDQTRLARPGLERMMAWAGVGEKQVSTLVTQLVGLGLVERVTIGRVGTRAEYRVFPYGVPPIPPHGGTGRAAPCGTAGADQPRLARSSTPRRRPSAAARTQQDVADRQKAQSAAEGAVDAGLPLGNPDGPPDRVALGEPSGLPQGNRAGSPGETPFLPPPSFSLPNPLPPRTGTGIGGAGNRRRAVPGTPNRWATAGGAVPIRARDGRRSAERRPTVSTVSSRTGCGSSSPSRSAG